MKIKMTRLCCNASARQLDPSSLIRFDRRSNDQSDLTEIKEHLLRRDER